MKQHIDYDHLSGTADHHNVCTHPDLECANDWAPCARYVDFHHTGIVFCKMPLYSILTVIITTGTVECRGSYSIRIPSMLQLILLACI